jgi:hypothetical protein
VHRQRIVKEGGCCHGGDGAEENDWRIFVAGHVGLFFLCAVVQVFTSAMNEAYGSPNALVERGVAEGSFGWTQSIDVGAVGEIRNSQLSYEYGWWDWLNR